MHPLGSIAAAQRDAFNTLLTQLARVVDQLETLVAPVSHIHSQTNSDLGNTINQEVSSRHDTEVQTDAGDKNKGPSTGHSSAAPPSYERQSDDKIDKKQITLDPVQLNWHYLLMDLKTVVLPEFYVVFNDPTTTATGRRQLYDLTQAIFFTLQRYLDASLTIHSKSASPSSSQANASSQSYPLTTDLEPDSYVTGQGENAQVALQLLDLARFVEVDGVTYITRFEPYYSMLIELDTLEAFLQQHSQQALITTFDQWQRARFEAFNVISPQTVAKYPDLLNHKVDHALAHWLLREVNGKSNLPAVADSEQPLIVRPQQFNTGVALSAIGLGILVVGLNVPFMGILSLLGVVFAFTGAKRIVPSLNFRGHHDKVASLSTQAMFISFIVMLLGTPLTPIALYAFLIAIWAKAANNVQRLTQPSPSLALPDKSPQMLGEIEATRIEPDTSKPEPLSLERHAYHLGILLSEAPTERLKQLITATNELSDHQSYLQSTYPYLATRVQELIKDLTDNTIIRLDELASRFVKDDTVSEKVRALFARQHESRIDALIGLNLKQVKDLNETILEKQMAVFSDIGSDQEREFRDAVMELKILLRWLIAQQPDELQASSHQVILDNLESSTLKDMQAVFFDNHTTSEQRQALLRQVESLIEHFKQQSPYTLDVNSGHVDSAAQEAKINNLLNLSRPQDSQSSDSSTRKTQEQVKAQEFVDFNQAYVAELIKYWH